MATLKNLLKIFRLIYPFEDFLYILQLEEYDSARYFNQLKRFFWRRNIQKRGKLVYTKRIKITLAVCLPISIISPPLVPVWVGLANFMLDPYFSHIKKNIQRRAKGCFAENGKNTQVIAIAGSFGKTTTKNYIYELARFNYKTQMVPGNINTPTGIANWILSDFQSSTEILVVEVDAYFVGEIGQSLTITPPDIAILTNIGDQHLERLGTKKNLKRALSEVFEYAKPNAVKIRNLKSSLGYALEVAKILKIPNDIVKDTVKKLTKPERRGDIKKINGFDVIDDSYNISEITGKAGIDSALKKAKQKKKKLIVVTAGIPELGVENKNGNKNLGGYLAKRADKVILLKSILHKDVLDSRLSEDDKVLLASDLTEAWRKLEELDPNGYLVLLQPELNDLYYDA